MRHVADDRERVDLALGEPGREIGFGERAGQGLVHVVVVRPRRDDLVQLPARRAFGEQRRLGRRVLLHDDDGHASSARRVHRAADVGKRPLDRRVLDRQIAGDVFVLHVDDDEHAAG